MDRPSTFSTIYKTWLFALLTAVLLYGCGGGGGTAPGTGSVAILLTDGPSAEFDEINLTITEIRLLGDDTQQVIFTGEETIDLLELENHAELFTIKDGVPEGSYEKIRLILSDVALIKKDDNGNIIEEYHPKLPGNGKLDLNPRGSFYISADETTKMQIDIDADKAIHIKQTGNEKYQFRPVVFVDIVDHIQPGKLIRYTGTVYSIDAGNNGFIMCRSIIRSSTDTKADDCVQVNIDEASIFNNDGDPVTLADLAVDDAVIVYGKLAESPAPIVTALAENDGVDIDLTLDAILVAIGTADSYMKLDGVVSVDYDATAKAFDMTVGPNQGFTADSVLTVMVNDATPVISRTGDPLVAEETLVVGTSVQSKGVLMVGDDSVLKSVLVIADIAVDDATASGPITFIAEDLSSINVKTATGEVCVDITTDTDFYQIIGSDSEQIVLDPSLLNTQVEVYGAMEGTCITADDILLFP